jgi:hypothetical protein
MMLAEVQNVMDNHAALFPTLKGCKKLEICGFVWFHGWKDQWSAPDEYASTLKHFIQDVRKDLKTPKLPFVIGVQGQNGSRPAVGGEITIQKAQLSMNDIPEFKGNVKAIRTDVLVDKTAEQMFPTWKQNPERWYKVGGDFANHYLGSAIWYNRIGKAMGEAMLELVKNSEPKVADRSVAEWVLAQNGAVTIRLKDKDLHVSRTKGLFVIGVWQNADLDQLPDMPFTITGVSFHGLQANQIKDDDLRRLAGLSHLEDLDLSRQPITAAGVAHVAVCKDLKTLSLYITNAGVDAIPAVQKFSKLEFFYFPIQNADQWAVALAKMPALRKAMAYQSDLSDKGVAELARLPRLEFLYLGGCRNVSDAGLKPLANCKSLRALFLCENQVVGGKMTLAEIARLKQALPDCAITYERGKAIPPPAEAPGK